MEHLFAAFLLVVVALELYNLNLKRKILLNNWQPIIVTLLSSALMSALFIFIGWWASHLLPDMSVATRVYVVVALLFLLAFYAFKRDKSYEITGDIAYANFGLFILIALGKSILHMIIGLIIGMMGTHAIWFAQSYLFAVIIFGIALLVTHKPFNRILGLPLYWMKAILYGLSALFLVSQFLL